MFMFNVIYTFTSWLHQYLVFNVKSGLASWIDRFLNTNDSVCVTYHGSVINTLVSWSHLSIAALEDRTWVLTRVFSPPPTPDKDMKARRRIVYL